MKFTSSQADQQMGAQIAAEEGRWGLEGKGRKEP